MEFGWVEEFFTAAKVYTALNVFLGFSVLFLLGYLLALRAAGPDRRARRPGLAGRRGGRPGAGGARLRLLPARLPPVAAQPWFLFAFVLGADLCLLVLAVLDAPVQLHLLAGTTAFLLLGAWMGGPAETTLLPWALGACFVFAVLHPFPLVLQRLRPDVAPTWWAHLFRPWPWCWSWP